MDTAEQKTVLIGVSGGIAAYKSCEIVRGLQKAGIRVKVMMTEHATHFIDPLTFRSLTHEPVAVGLFDDPSDPIHHISLAAEADVVLLAPCTANVMAKAAHGIADDLFKVRVKPQQLRCIGGRISFQIAQLLDQHPKERMHLAKRHRQLQEPFPCGFVLVSSHQLLNLGKNAIGVIEIRIVQVDQALPYILRFLQNRPALPQRLTVQRKALLALRRDVIPELHMFGKDHDRPPVRYIIISPQNNLLTFAYQHYTIIA